MGKKKKRDFWDDVSDDVMPKKEPEPRKESVQAEPENVRGARTPVNIVRDPEPEEYIEEYDEEEGFKLTKCMPVKIAARILLCVAAVIIGISGYVFYKYVDDRSVEGGVSSSYFDSNGFSREYNEKIEKLIEALRAIEGEGETTPERAAEIAASLVGPGGNFSFLVMNGNQERVVESGEDAKTRIESSNHYLQISNLDGGDLAVQSGIPTSGLNKNAWKTALDGCANAYNIYTAVDNSLAPSDVFYEGYLEYQEFTKYFDIAKVAGIVAIVVFIILLIFCVIATGSRKGYEGVRLNWFDKIFTELALIAVLVVLGILAYIMFYLMGHEMRFGTWLKAADAFVIYVVLIRAYFSLVRRIKSGTFIVNSLIYKACHGINMQLDKLPQAAKIGIIVVFLILLNGALVCGLLFMRDVAIKGIPVIFVAAPVIFVIELIAFISGIFGVGDADDYYYEDEPKALEGSREDIDAEDIASWEDVDFGQEIKEAEESAYEDYSEAAGGATQENLQSKVSDKTMILTPTERQKVLDSLGFFGAPAAERAPEMSAVQEHKADTQEDKRSLRYADVPVDDFDKTVIMKPIQVPGEDDETPAADVKIGAFEPEVKAEETLEDLGLVDFIQLNKDVRKLFRLKLKARTIGVTLRAPEKPILLDIDKSNAIKALSILFDNIEKYAEEGSRVYIEMYAQNGKMIYLMKNTIRRDMVDQVTTAMGPGLMEAKRIVQSEKGKFINSVEGDIYKVGILLDVASSK